MGGGLLATAAFPPYQLWPLVFAAVIPLAWAAEDLPPRRAWACGWWWGLAAGLSQLYWMMYVLTTYGAMFWPLALVVWLAFMAFLACFPAAAVWLASLGRAGGVPVWLGLPLAWAGLEWFKGWFLTGFPWLPLGQALAAAPVMVQSAELWGGVGLSAGVVLAGCLLALVIRPGRGRWRVRLAALAGVVIILGGGWLWGAARVTAVQAAMARAPHLWVSVVQADVPLEELNRRGLRLANLRRQVGLTRAAAGAVQGRPWLVVWSESSAPFYFLNDARASLEVLRLARELGAWILVGTMGSVERPGGGYAPTNRSWLVTPRGRPDGWYDKVHLVPFGEYVPLGRWLFFVRALAVVSEDFAPGQEGRLLDAGGVKLGPLICYESIFSELARAQRRRGARLLVNQTNDAWFGPTGASAQHLSHLVLRAVETRLAVARAANTGISGFVLPDGRVVQTLGLFRAGVETRRLPLMDRDTFYTRHGDLLGPGGLLAGLVAAAWGWRRRRFPAGTRRA